MTVNLDLEEFYEKTQKSIVGNLYVYRQFFDGDRIDCLQWQEGRYRILYVAVKRVERSD